MTTSARLPRETWERVKAADAERVAELLGLERARERRKWACPQHGGSDSLHAYTEERGGGFYCFACGEHFSTVDLAAVAWNVSPAEACERLAQALGVPVAGGVPARPPLAMPPRATRPSAPRNGARPPAAEVFSLWERARPVDDDAEASAWLTSRGLTPSTLARRDIVRALPRGSAAPAWASFRGPWSSGPWRLLVPLYGASGKLESLQARALDDNAEPKGLSPKEGSLAGLCFADQLARWLLEERTPSWWERPYRVVIAEGVPDYLTWATRHGDDEGERAPAVFGIMAGTWTHELASRIPDGARVTIRTHNDTAGDRYAERIAETLRGRCTVLRGKGGADGAGR